jgi:hypothetical protein
MRHSTPRTPTRRIAAALLLAAWCAPAPVQAQEEATAESVEEVPAEDAELVTPAPVEKRWYHEAQRQADVGFDLLIVRPLAGVTSFAGAVLFVPAAIFTAPNGKESLKEAYDRFVREPGEYFITRPLGEF